MSRQQTELKIPFLTVSALQNMHLLIFWAEDKYLLMLPGFILICLNSALCHPSLEANGQSSAYTTQSAQFCVRLTWRLEAEHPNLSVSDSHEVNATHLARMKGEDAPGGGWGSPMTSRQCRAIKVWSWTWLCCTEQHLLKPGSGLPRNFCSSTILWPVTWAGRETQHINHFWICWELHVTLWQQSWPYMLAFVSMSSIFLWILLFYIYHSLTVS